VLEAVSGRAPEPWELVKVIHAIAREGPHDCVTVDLSKLEMINSSFPGRTRRAEEASRCFRMHAGPVRTDPDRGGDL
jgi:hypothetical protein